MADITAAQKKVEKQKSQQRLELRKQQQSSPFDAASGKNPQQCEMNIDDTMKARQLCFLHMLDLSENKIDMESCGDLALFLAHPSCRYCMHALHHTL
jgi:hypothetical protein